MAKIPLAKLGSVGLVTDLRGMEMPPEALSYAHNVRLRAGGITRIEGEREIFDQNPLVPPYFLLPWEDNYSLKYIYGNETKLALSDGSTSSDVTRASGAYTATEPFWQGGVLTTLPYCNNAVDAPQGWDTTTSRFVDLPNWPAGTTCGVLRDFKSVMFAGNLVESGVKKPASIMWSHPAVPGAFPSSWDYTDDTKLTGFYTLAGDTGAVVDFVPLGEMLVAYTEKSTWIIRLVGGQYVFSSNKFLRRFGALAVNCVVEVSKKHYVFSQNDILVHDGSRAESLITDRIRDALFTDFDTQYRKKARAFPDYRKQEVWFCIPTEGSNGKLTKAYIYNYKYNTWCTRDLDDVVEGASCLVSYDTPVPMDSLAGTFDSQSRVMDSNTSNLAEEWLVLVRPKSYVDGSGNTVVQRGFLQVDYGTDFSGTPFTAIVKREDLPVAGIDRRKQVVLDPATVKYLRSAYPRISGSQGTKVDFFFGVQHQLSHGVAWSGPFKFELGKDTRLDPELSGNFLAYRVEFPEGAMVTFEGMDLELEVVGEL